jgi:hypothetical protein
MHESKPSWWVLYALFPLMVGALFLVNGSRLEPSAKSVADILVIFATFGAAWLWMRANEGAIERDEFEQAERAKKKSHFAARGWRSAPQPSPKPARAQEKLSITGFGSARNKAIVTHSVEIVSADRVRIRRRSIELRINPERNY